MDIKQNEKNKQVPMLDRWKSDESVFFIDDDGNLKSFEDDEIGRASCRERV